MFDFNPLMALTARVISVDYSLLSLQNVLKRQRNTKYPGYAVDAATFNGAGASAAPRNWHSLSLKAVSIFHGWRISAFLRKMLPKDAIRLFGWYHIYGSTKIPYSASALGNVVEAYGVGSNCAKKIEIFAYTGE